MPDTNTVAIGAPSNDGAGNNSGHVRIYSWNGSTWVQKGADIDGESAADFSGNAVSMPDANTVAIGARDNRNYAGHTRIYKWNGSAWIQKGTDIDGEPSNRSGWSVSMPDSNTLAIGAPLNSNAGYGAGHVRVFQWNSSTNTVAQPFAGELSVYPNPTAGELNIDLGRYCTDIHVVVKNTLGQEVFRKNFSTADRISSNIEGQSGIYFVELFCNEHRTVFTLLKK
jgi:hypothetical protein